MKKYKLPKTLTLDLKKWRCGGDYGVKGESSLGRGETELLNKQGCMCCLGQFAEQAGINRKDLRNA